MNKHTADSLNSQSHIDDENEKNIIEQVKKKESEIINGKEEVTRAKRLIQQEREKLMEQVHGQFRVAGANFHFKDQPSKLAFKDKGERMVSASNDDRVAKAMARMADAKGWETIKVSGHPEFQREVWMEASLRGIAVRGFKPTEQDLKLLEKNREGAMRNTIEHDKKIQEPKPKMPISDRAKVAEAVAEAFIDSKVKDPLQREVLKAAINMRIAKREKAQKPTIIYTYDRTAPSTKPQRSERTEKTVERNAERTR